MAITTFSGRYEFLSNFYASPIVINTLLYPTAEHAFQAFKTLDEDQHDRVRCAPSPSRAKQLGRRVTLRPDWESVRVEVMRRVVGWKFAQHPDLAALLVATGDEQLVEGNWWGDTFWGVCEGTGRNMLGVILMELRDSLRSPA